MATKSRNNREAQVKALVRNHFYSLFEKATDSAEAVPLCEEVGSALADMLASLETIAARVAAYHEKAVE